MDISKIMKISSSALKAQTDRMRVIAENVANSNSLPDKPGEQPYRRKTVTFKNELDRENGVRKVAVDRVREDTSPFGRRYEPGHPAADDEGYVLTPNVKGMVEMMDMRRAQRSYEANLGVIRTSRGMVLNLIGLLDE
ncbi:MAG: flagellar basal body rod protein FlgC [Alphaproteobacteria bacterium]|nr:flagellar basal body rod protein FlgC [Alphaproteobacteria bacterium]